MPNVLNLIENTHCVQSLKPAADAGGRTGDYVNVKNATKAYAVFHMDQGNAATIALSLVQATSSGGAGSKAVSANMRIAASADVSAASGDVLTEQAAAASFTTSAAVKPKIVIFEIDPLSALDLAGGFTWIAGVTGASNVANITQAMIWLSGLRYQEKPTLSARV